MNAEALATQISIYDYNWGEPQMKRCWIKMLAVMMVLVLTLSMLPLAAAENTTAYGKVTKDKVYLRKQPSTKADYWFRMDTNHVAQILEVIAQDGKTWYQVETEHPTDAEDEQTYVGYIMSDFFTPLTAEELAYWQANKTLDGASAPAQPAAQDRISTVASAPTTDSTANNIPVSNRQGEVTASGTNFRQSPSISGQKLMVLERGDIVELTSIPEVCDADHWYGVRYGGFDGYVMATYIRELPDTSGEPVIYGYVKLVKSPVNLREAPGGMVSVSDGWKNPGEVLPYVSAPVAVDGYSWYEILYNGIRYWVRGDCIEEVDGAGNATATAAPADTKPSTPDSSASDITPPAATTGYVTTTQNKVNLRLQPSGESITQIPKGVVLPYERTIEPYSLGNETKYTWYYVAYGELHGFVRGDCVKLNDAANAVPEQPTVTAEPTVVNNGYVKMIKAGVNVRETPGGKSLGQLDEGAVVVVTGPTSSASNYTWYPMLTPAGKAGYVRGDCVSVCDANGNLISEGAEKLPGAEPTQAPAPENFGYVRITRKDTNIRASMGGSVIGRVNLGDVLQMWGAQGSKNGVGWYPVIVNNVQAWVREDCAEQVNADGSQMGTGTPATPTTPPAEAQSSYVVTILADVNLRASASKDASSVAKVSLGTVLGYNGTTSASGSVWYRVVYENREVWVLGSCVRVMTQAEYNAWKAEHPNEAPSTSAVLGYVKTTADAVNLRDAADGTATGKRIDKAGTVMAYSEKQTVKNVDWFYVTLSDGSRGWINGKYIVETNKDGTPLNSSTSTPGTSGTYKPSTAGQEASYTTLQRGSTGTAVTALVTELKLQGYYTGAITSTYTAAVEEAVKALQKAKGLTVDGVAGPSTQHALFQTVPMGQGGTNVDFTFYPAEKIDWFTGGIQQQWAKGATAKVYDVKTGIVWTAKRWSGFNHADVEPLTAADTARLCKIYGVKKAQDIWDENHWEGRPILVLVGEHNYAASLMGMPHNYPSGDTIPNNDMDGQICIHFTNSKTSDSGIVKEDHVKAIEYAYTHAPAGQKK